ncbi:MAG TPA: CBS domain-containing protein, partial [Allocoleopsis sp.]
MLSHLPPINLETVINRNCQIVKPDTLIMEVCECLYQSQSNCVLVSENEQLLGVFSHSDLLKLVIEKTSLNALKVREVMTQPSIVIKITEYYNLFDLIKLFSQNKIIDIPVVDAEDKILGILNFYSLENGIKEGEKASQNH